MADIFSDVAGFLGEQVRQAITPDNVRDYTHASKLFVGDQYRLVPKNGFLFHMFIDIGAQYFDPQNPNSATEIGLMVKTADLPRFTVDTKTLNAYNRPNVVQNKLRYEPVTITFHDDSSNLIRNFWTNYLKYYYKDSNYALNTYGIPHKYAPEQIMEYGFTPQQSTPFLKAIRLYSLHQRRFSEYILVNPMIKSFRHGNHGQDKVGDTMQHEMVIEYEAVIYNSGRTSLGNPKGFALLHYDRTPSPISPAGGGPRSVFGPGGLIDTGRDVLDDISNGNYGSALFKAARGINAARGMNLRQRAVSEITGIVNRSIRESVATGGIAIPNVFGSSSVATAPYNGVPSSDSSPSLAGFLGGSNLSSSQLSAGDYSPSLSNFSTPFPSIGEAGGFALFAAATFAESTNTGTKSTQGTINSANKQQGINAKMQSITQSISSATTELGNAKNQVTNSTAALNLLNSKLNAAMALPDTNPNKQSLIDQSKQSIAQQQRIQNEASEIVTTKSAELDTLTQNLQALRAEKDASR